MLYHCAGADCADEIAQPANKFWKCHLRTFRARRAPLFCKRCFFNLKFERISHDLPTRFDREIEKLGLAGQERAWAQSKELRRWASKHASSRFVPETLLTAWKIQVMVDL